MAPNPPAQLDVTKLTWNTFPLNRTAKQRRTERRARRSGAQFLGEDLAWDMGISHNCYPKIDAFFHGKSQSKMDGRYFHFRKAPDRMQGLVFFVQTRSPKQRIQTSVMGSLDIMRMLWSGRSEVPPRGLPWDQLFISGLFRVSLGVHFFCLRFLHGFHKILLSRLT